MIPQTTRRSFLAAAASGTAFPRTAAERRQPNVVILITDDQGYGDLSLHGNPHLKTPNLDSTGTQGAQFTQFHVNPVCSPTRSCLMTGRYNYRTGVVDTYRGRSMMYPEEATLAELLGGAGYRTGIFGKWHLGDNYPMRAMDQGFQESVVHNGGGMRQSSDPPGSSYFDPIVRHNGKWTKRRGYCTDVFMDSALEFIEKNRARPFFAYIAANAPHAPLDVAESYAAPFRSLGLDERTAKIYGMVKNIDENAGRLLAKLKTLGLERDTILIYLTDNGPQWPRYNAGMRGTKGTVYEGGIRVPFFLRWPRVVEPGKTIDRIAAHIDLVPTLLDACGVEKPPALKLDGRSMMPMLTGNPAEWPDRTLFFQWHRGDEPELFRNCAARRQRYKLVEGRELYDLEGDPGERNDISGAHPEIVARMRRECEEWFRDVSSTRGYAPPRIHLGTVHENPVTLTQQDWRGPDVARAPDPLGYWEVRVAQAGRYRITLRTPPASAAGSAQFRLGRVDVSQSTEQGAAEVVFQNVALEAGEGRLEAIIEAGGRRGGPLFVDVTKL